MVSALWKVEQTTLEKKEGQAGCLWRPPVTPGVQSLPDLLPRGQDDALEVDCPPRYSCLKGFLEKELDPRDSDLTNGYSPLMGEDRRAKHR